MTDYPGYVPGFWYDLSDSQPVWGRAGQNTIQFAPFFVPADVTISDLGARIVTAQGSNNVQLAIYAHSATTGRPTGSALATTGNLSTATAGPVSGDIVGSDVTLPAGLYWFAVNHSGATSTIGGVYGNSARATAYYSGSSSLANVAAISGNNFNLNIAQTFGTWPDLTSAGFAETANVQGGPRIFVKVI